MAEVTLDQIDELLESVRAKCAAMGVKFYLEWSEAENLWYATADGQGKGEYWEAKKAPSAYAALSRLLEKIETNPRGLNT